MFDEAELEELYDALGTALDCLHADAASASELGDDTAVIDATISAYESLRFKISRQLGRTP